MPLRPAEAAEHCDRVQRTLLKFLSSGIAIPMIKQMGMEP
jgi:hypothetical protein